MIFPLITSLRQGSGWQARISADQEFRPTPSSDLQEATEKTEKMPFDSNHCSDSDYLTEGNQENEARDVCWDWGFVTFVAFCKSPKGSASWHDSVLSVLSCKFRLGGGRAQPLDRIDKLTASRPFRHAQGPEPVEGLGALTHLAPLRVILSMSNG